MLKKILLFLAMWCSAVSFAGVDVNKASEAELDSIKGIGPSTSAKILDERKKGNFKDWADLIARVNGVGQANAAKLSNAGLTVGGVPYKSAVSAPSESAEKARQPSKLKTMKEGEKPTNEEPRK